MTPVPRSHRVAVALLSIAGALATLPAAAQKVGVSSAVNPDVSGTPPGGGMRQLVIGQEVVHNEHITTSANGQTQILFLDESSMTVGPNSDVTIDKFVYDPKTGTGQMAVTAAKGVLRYVGGKLSKQDNGVTVNTSTATIGVRGGSFLMNDQPGQPLEVVFIYGKALQVTGLNGVAQELRRRGFEVTVAGPGASPSAPKPAPPSAITGILVRLNGMPGATGGARTAPTNATVAASGISSTISGNVTASIQAAVQNSPPPPQPAAVNVGAVQTNLSVNTVQATGQAQIAQAQSGHITPPSPPPPPSPPVGPFAGLIKTTNGNAAAGLGFTDQSAGARIPFSGGTITYPPGTVLQNGAFAATIDGLNVTLSPLTPGSRTAVTAQASGPGINGAGTATGTAFTTADNTFFYADLVGSGTNADKIFAFAGTPVSQAFFAGNLPAQIMSFQVQPDATLASGAQPQTIPFLPPGFGGTFPNAAVSDLYLVTGANSPFGSNASSSVAPKFLQAGLAVNGQGASQTSALVIATGSFFTSADTGMVVAGGPVRGTVMLNATSPPVHISGGLGTVPDGNGNNLFGGSTLSGFVLDQNSFNFNGNFVPALALAGQFGQNNVNFAFNQPVTSIATPAGVGTNRQALDESGFFGGIMSHTTSPTSGSPYIISGTAAVQSTPANNRIAATFAGTDPFTSSQSGINSLVLSFGSNTPQTNSGRGTFVDNNIYAATDSTVTQSFINGNALALPQNNTTSTPQPVIGMVTSATVGGGSSWFPASVTPCACQFLQWGYWTGQVSSTPSEGLGVNRTDRASINTWIAGMPTVNMPTTGMGTFNGAAVGTVFNGANGATYLAAGNFNQTYNFGSMTGTVNITNFDGQNYKASVGGSGNIFGGSLAGLTNPSRSGVVIGSFFGPNAVETGGSFNIHATSGPAYLASGIFAGK